MTKMKEANSDRILFIVFILAVFIDAANGILQKKIGITTPIGVIFRGAVFFYFFLYLFKNRYRTHFYFLIIFIFMCLLLWSIFYSANLIREFQYLIRYAYFFVVLNYFSLHRDKYNLAIVYKYIMKYGFIISSIILICYFTGFGVKSYGEGEYGWGEKGLFIATNDIGLTILCTLVCSCIYQHLYCRKKWEITYIIVIALGGILVGSRVCFIFIPFTLLLFTLYKAKKTKNKIIVILSMSLTMCVVIYIAYQIYQMLDDYALAKLTQEGFENARTKLTDEAKRHISNFDALSVLIGEGVGNLHDNVGRGLGIDGEKFVEADYYEIVGSFGYLLGGMILFFYLLMAIQSIKYFLKRRNFESFEIMYMILSFIVIGYFAGHAATNMMATPVLAVSALVIWNKKRNNQIFNEKSIYFQ